MGRRKIPLDVAFRSKGYRVNEQTGCWEWAGLRNAKGYGIFHYHGAGNNIFAPRASLTVAGVDVPGDKVVMHTCDNPPCVNPDHLRIGTISDNARDMASKGRGVKGGPSHPLFGRLNEKCNKGHLLTSDNIVSSGSDRRCKICRMASNKISNSKRLYGAAARMETVA